VTNLQHVADYAYPNIGNVPVVTMLPADVRTVAGYAGGNTPHAWSRAEITAVTATSRAWWPIWTMPEQALTGIDGTNAASAMAAVLQGLGITSGPVLLDIEHSAWLADMAGANAAAQSWRDGMRMRGYHISDVYGPHNSAATWIADWTGQPPANLPQGIAGWQYASDEMLKKPYDLSVFDMDLMSETVAAPLPPVVTPEPITYTVRQGDSLSAIADRYGTTWQNLYAWNRATIGEDPNLIHPGIVLYLHGAAPAPVVASPSQTYEVRSGDTLSAIGQRYSQPWQKIYNANRNVIGNNPNLIRPGMILHIP
jgi:LysM repeat protein